tara:strand:+ start:190 stop:1137 length:948 start_codon:yes stop_codon:yes gene_type:complete
MYLEVAYPNLHQYDVNYLFKNGQPINGLGNVLFRLATQYALCKKYKYKQSFFVFDMFIKYGESIGMFQEWRSKIFQRILSNPQTDDFLEQNKFQHYHVKNAYLYDENVSLLMKQSQQNVIMSGYLQSLQWFHEYKADITKMFAPDEESQTKIYEQYPDLNDSNVVTISIHLRLEWNSNVPFTYDDEFVKNALEYLKYLIHRDKKIVCYVLSDNIQKAQKILNALCSKYTFVFCEGNLDYVDLWLISLCDHNILCHSTFSWWGAYLNQNKNKVVIYPSDVISFYSKMDNISYDVMKENHYPKEWICMDSTSMRHLS